MMEGLAAEHLPDGFAWTEIALQQKLAGNTTLLIFGLKHWLWRVIDQTGTVLDVLWQGRRDTRAAKLLLRKLLKRQCRILRAMVPTS